MSAAAHSDEYTCIIPFIMAAVIAAHITCDAIHWQGLSVDEFSMSASPQRRHALALQAYPSSNVLQAVNNFITHIDGALGAVP